MTPLEILGTVLLIVLKSFVLLSALLVFIAYALLADRKIWAAVQLRRGPNVVGPFGLFQSFADLLKFVLKEPVIPASSDKPVFLLAPLVAVTLALATFAVIPVAQGWVIADINIGILYVFAISSLEVYGVIMGGWASNSKYAFLGALRSAAQMVSYEVSIGFVIIIATAHIIHICFSFVFRHLTEFFSKDKNFLKRFSFQDTITKLFLIIREGYFC